MKHAALSMLVAACVGLLLFYPLLWLGLGDNWSAGAGALVGGLVGSVLNRKLKSETP